MKVFASGLGQRDNIGDTALRRSFLSALRPIGQLHVFTGGRNDDYRSGLGLHVGDVNVEDARAWRLQLTRTFIQGRAVYAFNAGEMEVDRHYATYYLRILPLLLVFRLRGGVILHTGFGIRAANRRWEWALRLVLRLAHVVSWRDAYSRKVMGVGEVAPDWAFSEGSSNAQLETMADDRDRSLLAVSLRYDRDAPSDAWLETLKSYAASRGLDITFVSQIERDSAKASALAQRVGGVSIPWTNPALGEQEARIREVYRQSEFIVSDRLHALVVGATEGALPICLANSELDKTARTLDVVGLGKNRLSWASAEDVKSTSELLDLVSSERAQVISAVVTARAQIDVLRDQIRRAVSKKARDTSKGGTR